jgi:hypothetical protein
VTDGEPVPVGGTLVTDVCSSYAEGVVLIVGSVSSYDVSEGVYGFWLMVCPSYEPAAMSPCLELVAGDRLSSSTTPRLPASTPLCSIGRRRDGAAVAQPCFAVVARPSMK